MCVFTQYHSSFTQDLASHAGKVSRKLQQSRQQLVNTARLGRN